MFFFYHIKITLYEKRAQMLREIFKFAKISKLFLLGNLFGSFIKILKIAQYVNFKFSSYSKQKNMLSEIIFFYYKYKRVYNFSLIL